MASAPEPTASDLDVDATGAIPAVSPRLSDFVAGEPRLPYAYLLVVAGPDRGHTLEVADLPVVVGRSADADLVIADDTVSRRHAELGGDREGLVLTDLGSSNGTTLNGNPMAGGIALHDGDLVGFGSAVVVVKRIA